MNQTLPISCRHISKDSAPPPLAARGAKNQTIASRFSGAAAGSTIMLADCTGYATVGARPSFVGHEPN